MPTPPPCVPLVLWTCLNDCEKCVHLVRWLVGVVCDSIRNTTLDIISRLPASEAVEPFAAVLMTSVMKCLEDDNEENALVCLRVLFELFKNVKTTSMEVGRWWACMFGRRVCDSALCGFRVCTSMSPCVQFAFVSDVVRTAAPCNHERVSHVFAAGQQCASTFVTLATTFFRAFGDIMTKSFSAQSRERVVEAPDPTDDVGGTVLPAPLQLCVVSAGKTSCRSRWSCVCPCT